ncbi:hypothetical protein HK102_004716 [Quaeritorhiza haematococci]|nr:hypothetical protein HK102_004716 [Quaeritorhiza haematococci]
MPSRRAIRAIACVCASVLVVSAYTDMSALCNAKPVQEVNDLIALKKFFEDDIGVVRKNPQDDKAYMISHKVMDVIAPNQQCMVAKDGARTAKPWECGPKEESELDGSGPVPGVEVPSVQIEANWIHASEEENQAQEANILGGFGTLQTDFSKLNIPGVMATPQNVRAYGAHLVKQGSCLTLEDHQKDFLPAFDMSVGPTYVENYLLQPSLGTGFYVEYHDRPHLHMPLNDEAYGYLILGKKVGSNKFQFTGFQIPYGYAIYSPPNTIHCDAYLIGKYNVVYSKTPEFSTVIMKDSKGGMVKPKVVAADEN